MDTIVSLSVSVSLSLSSPFKVCLQEHKAFKILHFVLANPYIYWPHQIHWKFQL